jgi:hypothetical protein
MRFWQSPGKNIFQLVRADRRQRISRAASCQSPRSLSGRDVANRERAAGFLPVGKVLLPLYYYSLPKRCFGKGGANKFQNDYVDIPKGA